MNSTASLRSIASNPRARGLTDHIAVRVVRLAESMARHATRTIEARWGLKNTDLRLLNVMDGAGPLTVSELSRRTHVDKAWVSRSLRDLERRKIVCRQADRKDTRLALLSLSAPGQRLLDEVRPIALQSETRMLRGLDARTLKRLLDALESNVEQMLDGLATARGGSSRK
jgi:DNA-binding MarR family transcriptional regulator